jgi:alpha-L-fucosidase
MARTAWVILALAAAIMAAPATAQDFEPTWESLNSRETPEWFRDAKLGIFIHWGVYSVPAYCHPSTYSEWYYRWLTTDSHDGFVTEFHNENYGEDFTYQQFAPMFRAELWDPAQWASLFERAGARYVVLVSKHHDGYALWPSEHASSIRGYPWTAAEVGPERDLVGELTDAVRAEGLKMGFYYSFMEWTNPLYDESPERYAEEFMIPQIRDLFTRYQPTIFWPDGEWDHPDSLWHSPEILDWMYENTDDPESFVVNDRWGRGLRGQVGDYYTTEYGNIGGGSPGLSDSGKPFEECRGIGHSFAYNRIEDVDSYLSREELIRLFVEIVSADGNLLLNLGPTADGRIPVIQQDRIVALGEWLDVNGDGIYGTRGSVFTGLPWGRSTTKGNTIYLHVFDWPQDGRLVVPGLETPIQRAYLLHEEGRPALPFEQAEGADPVIDLWGHLPFDHVSVVALELDGTPVVDQSVRPSESGAVVLTPDTAQTTGSVQMETKGAATEYEGRAIGSNLGFWIDPASTVSWQARVEAGETYAVLLEYACEPGNEGGRFRVNVGEEALEATVEEATESWTTYEWVELGEVPAGDADRVSVVARATEIPDGKALLNLRRLVLVPAE